MTMAPKPGRGLADHQHVATEILHIDADRRMAENRLQLRPEGLRQALLRLLLRGGIAEAAAHLAQGFDHGADFVDMAAAGPGADLGASLIGGGRRQCSAQGVGHLLDHRQHDEGQAENGTDRGGENADEAPGESPMRLAIVAFSHDQLLLGEAGKEAREAIDIGFELDPDHHLHVRIGRRPRQGLDAQIDIPHRGFDFLTEQHFRADLRSVAITLPKRHGGIAGLSDHRQAELAGRPAGRQMRGRLPDVIGIEIGNDVQAMQRHHAVLIDACSIEIGAIESPATDGGGRDDDDRQQAEQQNEASFERHEGGRCLVSSQSCFGSAATRIATTIDYLAVGAKLQPVPAKAAPIGNRDPMQVRPSRSGR